MLRLILNTLPNIILQYIDGGRHILVYVNIDDSVCRHFYSFHIQYLI